ncbi:MAG: sigma-54 dependent transcriptional regulator [Rikenellaceae bacterium]
MELNTVKQRFGIIGNSPQLNRALEVALRVAATDLSVLVTGESGVGKEFFPQVIHAHSARKHNRYIAVNCGAIPEGTIDSELFGHEKGSFTGAIDARKGYFEEADGGTIFLDEVAELPLSTQVRLLRVLQTGEFLRVGSAKTQKVNVRVVAATNINLQRAIDEGRFREDLFYRLSTVPIVVPALRERREDIFLLFRKFASDVATQYRMPAISLDEGARKMVERYYWRGNIRQLKNVAEQISAIEQERTITAEIMQRYLPELGEMGQSIVSSRPANQSSRGGDFDGLGAEPSDRELLYKILFDMHKDMAEMKRMMLEMRHSGTGVGGVATASQGGTSHHEGLAISGLLPSSMSSGSAVVDNIEPSEYYTFSEEVSDEQPRELTKADMQREQISRALKRNNGRRREAAAELFMSERTLYRKIKELGIEGDF